MNELENLTIIMVAYDLPELVNAQLRFWSGKGPQVYLFDGSEQSSVESLPDGLAGNVHYIHSPTSVFDRLLMGAKIVKTDYVAMLATDDFFAPSGLEECIKQLDKNKNLSSCGGATIGFVFSNQEPTFHQAYTTAFFTKDWSDDPGKRMISHMKKFQPSSFYSPMRKDVFQSCIKNLVNNNPPVFAYGDVFMEITAKFFGAHGIVNAPVWMRGFHPARYSFNESMYQQNNLFETWWTDSKHKKNKDITIENLVTELHTNSTLSKKRIRLYLTTALQAYSDRKKVSVFSKVVISISSILPASFKYLLRPIYYKLRYGKKLSEVNKKPEIIKEFSNIEDLLTAININFCDFEIQEIRRYFFEDKRVKEELFSL